MWKVFQATKAGEPVNIRLGLDDACTVVTEGLKTLDAHWRSSAITTAVTTTVVEAKVNESILLTDIMVILSKKVTAATIIVRFSDGTNAVNMFTLDAGTNPFQFSHAFQGGLRGWKDASLQVVTDDTTTVSVLVGYVHISSEATQSYDVWDSDR